MDDGQNVLHFASLAPQKKDNDFSSPRTAFNDGLVLRHTFLNIADTSFFPSQSANSTSWNTNGDPVDASVSRTMTCVAVATAGPFIERNSSFERPSFRLS